jgi:RNA polymerase sigma-70 factor (ECF subfamily)
VTGTGPKREEARGGVDRCRAVLRPSPGDQEARAVTNWDRIVRDYGSVVFGTAWRILGHAADAEDVAQEVFLQAYQIQQEEAVRSWEAILRRLTTCRALDRLRQRRGTVSLEGQRLASTISDPESVAVERELADRLRVAIARLPRREGAIFCLRCFDGLTYEEIADALQTTVGAVATGLHKARSRLEASLMETAQER